MNPRASISFVWTKTRSCSSSTNCRRIQSNSNFGPTYVCCCGEVQLICPFSSFRWKHSLWSKPVNIRIIASDVTRRLRYLVNALLNSKSKINAVLPANSALRRWLAFEDVLLSYCGFLCTYYLGSALRGSHFGATASANPWWAWALPSQTAADEARLASFTMAG